MLEDKEMYSDIVVYQVETLHFILGSNLLLSNLIAPLDLLNESRIMVLDIALLENNRCDFMLTS